MVTDVNSLPRGFSSTPLIVLFSQLPLTLWSPMDCSPPGFSVQRILQARILAVGSHSLLQGVFWTQRSNLSLLHCRQILHHLSHQGSLWITKSLCYAAVTNTAL